MNVASQCLAAAKGPHEAPQARRRSGVPLHDTGGVHVPVGIGRAPELNPPTDSVAVYCNVNMVLRLPFPVSAFHQSSP